MLAAVQSLDINALRSQFVFVDQPCTQPQGIGAIPCPEGAALGTPVRSSCPSSCEGSFIFPTQTDILETVATNFVSQPLYLYAIAAASANDTLHASYLLFFGQAYPGIPGLEVAAYPGKTVWVNDTGVVAVNSGCRDGVVVRVQQTPHGPFVLAPKTSTSAPQPPIVGSGVAPSASNASAARTIVLGVLAVVLITTLTAAALKRSKE